MTRDVQPVSTLSESPPAWVDVVFLVLFGLLAYGRSLTAGFMIDDYVCLVNRPDLAGWSWAKIVQDFSTSIFGIQAEWGFRPLQTLLSRALLNAFGMQPMPFHAAGLLLHLGGAILLQELTRQLGLSRRAGFMAASLFVVNPAGMDQFLLAAAGLSEPLSLVFATAAILIALRGSRSRHDLLSAVLSFLAILSKEASLLLPLLTVGLFRLRSDRCPRPKRIVIWGAPALLYLVLFHQRIGEGAHHAQDWRSLAAFSVYQLPSILLHYVRLAIVPWDLHAFAMVPPRLALWWLSGIVIVAATLAAFRKRGIYLMGWLWFMVWLGPKIVTSYWYGLMLDHYVYTSTYGLYLVLAYGLDAQWARRASAASAGFGLALLLGLGSSVYHFSQRNSEEKNLRWTLRYVSTPSLRLHLAAVYLRTHRPEEALPILRSLWDPSNPDRSVGYDLALALAQTARTDESRAVMARLRERWPSDALFR